MTDEHPNERLVTPSEDGEGFDRSLVSRRQMLGGSALLAGLLAYTSDPTQLTNPNVGVARAADNPDEPLIILGPESDPVGYLFQDTAGGIILQDATSGNHFWYNESEGRWETDAELDVPALTTDGLDYNGLTPDFPVAGTWILPKETADQTTSSTGFTGVLIPQGVTSIDIPTNATLYGRFVCRMSISSASETVTARPRVFTETEGTVSLGELDITHTGDTNKTMVDSGWTEITSTLTGPLTATSLLGKVTGGTGTFEYDRTGLMFAGVESVA